MGGARALFTFAAGGAVRVRLAESAISQARYISGASLETRRFGVATGTTGIAVHVLERAAALRRVDFPDLRERGRDLSRRHHHEAARARTAMPRSAARSGIGAGWVGVFWRIPAQSRTRGHACVSL